MKKIYGGWWADDIGKELNLNILISIIFMVIFFGAEAVRNLFWAYIVIKAISLLTVIYYIGCSLILTKKVYDKLYK